MIAQFHSSNTKSEKPVEMSVCFLKNDGEESDSGSVCTYIFRMV